MTMTPENLHVHREPSVNAPLTGVVLAGGLGRRLGRNKSSIRLACGGRELDILARSMELLTSVCDRAIIVGRQLPGYECHQDEKPGNGPMGGIATALEKSGGPCFVLSCDLPFMEKALLDRLVLARRNRPDGTLCTAYRNRDNGRIEALVAIYELETLPLFRHCLDRGLLKISLTVPMERQHFVLYGSREARGFFNINYPADLTAARRILTAMGQ